MLFSILLDDPAITSFDIADQSSFCVRLVNSF